MTALAPTLQAFFVTGLDRQRGASVHTVDSYRHAFRLLLAFARAQTGKQPSDLDIADLDAELISRFLDHLEIDRHNSVASRNTRLAAIHSFFRFASYRHPEHADTIWQVMAIPQKKGVTIPRSFLTEEEMDVLAAAPDRSTWAGRRDHTLLVVALRTGLRLSELTSLRCQDVQLGPTAHLKCLGKGRKRRDTPLDKPTVSLLRSWLSERQGGPDDVVFPSRRGGQLSPDAVQRLIAKHVATARRTCPNLDNKRISTHNLRHSCAMDLLRSGVDSAVLAMWLGHEKLESVNAYIHADPTLKQRALDRRSPVNTQRSGYYKPGDKLLAFLERL
ncbi:MAG TPA: tyrosine-type recombinase/integrase [Acidimicrobiales bacterium]|nr:tyrosine-type recombinase/integrase [Acidimicrobiales bacterium]